MAFDQPFDDLFSMKINEKQWNPTFDWKIELKGSGLQEQSKSKRSDWSSDFLQLKKVQTNVHFITLWIHVL